MILWYWGLVSAGRSNPDQVLSALEVLVVGTLGAWYSNPPLLATLSLPYVLTPWEARSK